MAFPTRENSGLEITVDEKGKMRFRVHGHDVPASSIATESEAGPHSLRGVTTIKILTQFIKFSNVETPPYKLPDEHSSKSMTARGLI